MARTARRSSSRLSKTRWAGLFVVAVLAIAPRAWAEGHAEAEALITHGLELRRQHDDAGALADFKAALAVEATPRCRAQIGLAEQSLGAWLAAEADLRAALAASDDPWIAKHREKLEEAAAYVGTQLGWIELETNVAGAEVTVDGAKVGVSPLADALRVAVGPRVVRVSAEGRSPVERTVMVAAGAHAHESIELVVLQPPRPPRVDPPAQPHVPPPPPDVPRDRAPSASVSTAGRPPVFWTGVGAISLGAIGLGIGAGFGVEAIADKAARDQHCNGTRCDPQGGMYDSAAHNAATISTAVMIAGAATTVVGVVLLWTSSGARAPSPALALIPRAGPGSCSLEVQGAW